MGERFNNCCAVPNAKRSGVGYGTAVVFTFSASLAGGTMSKETVRITIGDLQPVGVGFRADPLFLRAASSQGHRAQRHARHKQAFHPRADHGERPCQLLDHVLSPIPAKPRAARKEH